jgi:hypothetical protein
MSENFKDDPVFLLGQLVEQVGAMEKTVGSIKSTVEGIAVREGAYDVLNKQRDLAISKLREDVDQIAEERREERLRLAKYTGIAIGASTVISSLIANWSSIVR